MLEVCILCLHSSLLSFLFCSLITDFLKFAWSHTHTLFGLSWTCSAHCRRDWNCRRRSFHLLQPSLLIVSQVTAACECGWGASMTSSASGASGVVADILNYLGRMDLGKEKKKPSPQEFQCLAFFTVKFVSWLWNVKCSPPIVDTDQPKIGEEPAGAVGFGRGQSERRATVRQSFYDK